MFRPAAFAVDELPALHGLIERYPLGTLITPGPEGVLANLVPFSLHAIGAKGTLRCHVARANTHIPALRAASEALVVFQGPNAYVSANWYPTKQQHGKAVPTWNYSVVHARGRPTVIDDPQWILAQITDLTNAAEKGSPHPWRVSDAPEEYILSQLKALIGIEIPIERIEGKFKVSQNQPEINREAVAERFAETGQADMAELVKKRGP